MKNIFTLKKIVFYCLNLAFALGVGQLAKAQTIPDNFADKNNWSCRFLHGGSATMGTGAYDADQYNNDTIPAFPAGTQNYAFIGSDGWIKAYWFAPNFIQGIDKIVFYKNARPLTHCSILHYDAIFATWDTVLIRYRGIVSKFYDDIYNLEADSVEIVGCMNHAHPGANGRININTNSAPPNPPIIDTIMIAGVQTGIANNPDFREIQFWRRNYTCSGNTEIVGGIQGQPATAGLANPVLNPCPGFGVHLNAMSAYDDTGHRYQWQINPGTGWTDIPGANGMGYFYNGPADASFQVIDTCLASATWSTSNTIQVSYAPVPTPRYFPFSTATNGYYQGFDNAWNSSTCLTAPFANDIPNDGLNDRYWANNPPYFYYSWRMDSTSNVSTPTIATTTLNSGWQGLTSGAYPANGSTYPYGPFPAGSRKSARLHTSTTSYTPGWSSNLDFYIDFTGVTGNKAMYFYFINRGEVPPTPANSAPNFNNQDTLRVLSSTDGGLTWSTLGVFDTAQFFTKELVTIPSTGPTIIRFQGTKYGTDGVTPSDIGIDSVYVAPQCSGTPVAGNIKATGNGMPAFPFPANSIAVCPGSTLKLTTLGATMAGNLVYEWEQNTNGVNWTPVNGGSGFNSLFFQTPPIYDTVWYRLSLKCGATGTVVYSDTIKINMSSPGPSYATLPYRQNFETWVSKCSQFDVPVSAGNVTNWVNAPFAGNNSWRQENTTQAQSGWGSTANGLPTPVPGLSHAARFHSSQVQANQKGVLDLLFNGSAANGPKELRFFYVNATGDDSLEILYSTDAGSNFTMLASVKNDPIWTQHIMQIPCNTPNCVIRFRGSGDLGNTSDIGIDSVTVTLPCTGAPNAGVITGAVPDPCAGTSFTLNLQNFTNTGGLSFIWESSTTDSVTGFTSVYPPPLLDTTKTFFTTSITVPTWFRVIVRCNYSGLADTVVRLITPAQFYYCYCTSYASLPTGADIGNVKIRRMPSGVNVLNNPAGGAVPQNNNPTANRIYTDYRNPPSTLLPTPLYLDSSYELTISQINNSNFNPPGTTVTVWVDSNHNGVFDANEIFLNGNSVITTLPSQVVATSFTIPSTMRVGVTGMRIVMSQGINLTNLACGNYTGEGETEDYLVDIRYHPCTAPASAGTVEVSDTGVCAGYTVTLVDTSHQTQLYGLRWVWQYSPDSNSWSDISGSLMRDTVVHLVNSLTYYRLMMVCITNFDTTYSNVKKVVINPPYSCYCYSLADGGVKDTSDIGGLYLIGSSGDGVTVPVVGPHLLNPWAVNSRTDYTRFDTLHLYLDSMYQLMVYHTIKKAFHGDAKVTLFMDFNNDLQYNITNNSFNERVWTGFTTSSTFTLIDSIMIPSYAIPGVMSGMRLILNNDTGPNPQSDSACGAYVSGETEDYVVMFHNPANPYYPTGLSSVSNVSDFRVFPNPTEGKFSVSFEAKQNVGTAKIIVTNVAGQQILGKQVFNPGKKLNEELDLSNMARGLYFVELHADNEKMIKKLIVK